MKICLIFEGNYPYVKCGVSNWAQHYIQTMEEHEFVLWLVNANYKDKDNFQYELPKNVVEVHQVFLDEAFLLRSNKKEKENYNKAEMEELNHLLEGKKVNWNVLFKCFHLKKRNPVAFFMSQAFMDSIHTICLEKYPYASFHEMFHTIRSMVLPVLYLIGLEVPKADVYHSIGAGYGGLLGSLAKWKMNKPLLVTEHGIYAKEREIEILSAKWVGPYFKQQWIDFFNILSKCAYQYAVSVTTLYERAMDLQVELGCDREKISIITNGISYETFSVIPIKAAQEQIDIGAIVRISKTKDIKTMLYAFAELQNKVPNAILHILGEVEEEEYYKECLQLLEHLEIKQVEFVGYVDVAEYMKKLDFIISTSISEAQPLGIIEALAAGRPCIVTDVGGCRELVDGTGYDLYGNAGICIPVMSKDRLAEALEKLCLDQTLRLQMGEVGRMRVNKSFNQKKVINQYLELYRKVNI